MSKRDLYLKFGLISLFVGLLILFTLLFFLRPVNLTSLLNKLDISMDLDDGYKIIEYKNIQGDPIKEIFTTNEKDIIKIQVITGLSDEQAVQYIMNQRYLVDNLFNEQNIPYPGMLSNTLKCPEKYHPKIEEKQRKDSRGVFYYLYANDRLTFGGCAEDILEYSVVLAFIYCKEKNEVYQIEYFTPKDNPTQNYKQIVKSFKCKK